MEVGWNIRDTDDWGEVSNQYNVTRQTNQLYFFLLTFSFAAWGSRDVGRAFFEMNYIASFELGNLAGFVIIYHVDFTYVAVVCIVISIVKYTILPQMLRTLDDIHNSWANVFCGDGLASVKLAESRE